MTLDFEIMQEKSYFFTSKVINCMVPAHWVQFSLSFILEISSSSIIVQTSEFSSVYYLDNY